MWEVEVRAIVWGVNLNGFKGPSIRITLIPFHLSESDD